MPRYIVICRHSGYVYGDTLAFERGPGDADGYTPLVAVKMTDAEISDPGRTYVETNLSDIGATYDVFRADISGPDDLPLIDDGQDQDILDRITRGAADYITSFIARSTL